MTLAIIVIVVSTRTLMSVSFIRTTESRKSDQLLLLLCETGERNLDYYFNIKLNDEEIELFQLWDSTLPDDTRKEDDLKTLELIFRNIWAINHETKKFNDKALLESVSTVWYKLKYNSNIGDRTLFNPKHIDDVFDDGYVTSRIVKYRVLIRNEPNILRKIRYLIPLIFGK